MRALHKSWQNKRPGWTRRVRWYQGTVAGALSVRLNFDDTRGEHNEFFTDAETAQTRFDGFKTGSNSWDFGPDLPMVPVSDEDLRIAAQNGAAAT